MNNCVYLHFKINVEDQIGKNLSIDSFAGNRLRYI